MPRATPQHSGGSYGDNPSLLSQKSSTELADHLLRAACRGPPSHTAVCWRSLSDTQTTRLGDWEVRTVSEGSGEALSSKLQVVEYERLYEQVGAELCQA